EHNRFLLQVEDRSNGYPRHHTIGGDFVTAGEYRTLLANRRDLPAIGGDMIVASSGEPPDEPVDDVPAAATDGTVMGGAPADQAPKLAADPKDRQRKPSKI